MIFDDFSRIESFTCVLEVEVDGKTTHTIREAPQIMLQASFMSYVERVADMDVPARVKMSRQIPIFNDHEQRWIQREGSVEFKNNAYLIEHNE